MIQSLRLITVKSEQINEFFLAKYKNLCDEYPEFHLKRLERIAYYKTIAGEDGSNEYIAHL